VRRGCKKNNTNGGDKSGQPQIVEKKEYEKKKTFILFSFYNTIIYIITN